MEGLCSSLSSPPAPVLSSFCEALAACHTFIQTQSRGVVFEPTPALRSQWARQGEALTALLQQQSPLESVAAVRRAWLLEANPTNTGSLAAITERNVAIVFAQSAQPLTLEGQPYDAARDGAITVWLRPRPPIGPRVFPLQQEALDAADTLPWCGFLMVWAQDVPAKGTKQYLVASLDDFWYYYRGLDPPHRNHYELIRTGRRVPFVADLEYPWNIKQNRHLDPHELLREFKALVERHWLQETGTTLDPAGWILYDSSTTRQGDGDDPMMAIDSDGEAHEVLPDKGKVSFHLIHHGATFADLKEAHGAFSQRLERAAPPSLMVCKWYNEEVVEGLFFMDQSIYSANRCFRMPFLQRRESSATCGQCCQINNTFFESSVASTGNVDSSL